MGRPIWRVISAPISSARSSIQSTMRRQIAIRWSSGTRFHRSNARTPVSSAWLDLLIGDSVNSAQTLPSMGLMALRHSGVT